MMNKRVIHTTRYVVKAPHIKHRKYKVYQITKSINKRYNHIKTQYLFHIQQNSHIGHCTDTAGSADVKV